MSQRTIRRAGVTVAGLLLVGGGLAGATEFIHSSSPTVITAGEQMPPPLMYTQEPVTADASAPAAGSAAEPVAADASVPAGGYAPVAANAPAPVPCQNSR
jgi:hypothetical protein